MLRSKTIALSETKLECTSMRPIDNLALEGGGAKGYFHLGVFLALDQMGILQNVKRIAGTSIGAYLGFKIALGCSPIVLINKSLMDLRPDKLFDFLDFIPNNSNTHYPANSSEFMLSRFFKNIYNVSVSCMDVLQQSGLFYGKYIEDDLITDIREKFPSRINLTFGELHELRLKYPELNLKDLYVTATNITDNCLTVFSYETTPHMSIPLAVRCSMAVPGVFKPVQYLGKLYYDGGLKCNLPVRIFDNEKYLEKGSLTSNKYNMRTLGVCLSSPKRTNKMRDRMYMSSKPMGEVFNSLLSILLIPIILQDIEHRVSHNPLRTIFLDTHDVTVFNLHLSREKVTKAILRAKEQTIEYVGNYIKNVPDPNAETLESQFKKLKVILWFYSLYMPHDKKKMCMNSMRLFIKEMKDKNEVKHSEQYSKKLL